MMISYFYTFLDEYFLIPALCKMFSFTDILLVILNSFIWWWFCLCCQFLLFDFLEHSGSGLPLLFDAGFFKFYYISKFLFVFIKHSLLAIKTNFYFCLIPLLDNQKPKLNVSLSSGFGHKINVIIINSYKNCCLASCTRKFLSDWIIRKLKVSEVYYLIFIS